MPLPPKPDEGPSLHGSGTLQPPRGVSPAASSLAATSTTQRSTPPPPYFPTRLTLAPVPAPRFHSYINDDAGCYFTPISDEEAQLITGSGSMIATSSPQTSSSGGGRTRDNTGFEVVENPYLQARVDDSGPESPDTAGTQSIEMQLLVPPPPTALSSKTSSDLYQNGSVVVPCSVEDEEETQLLHGHQDETAT
jgi:hypothetical protein